MSVHFYMRRKIHGGGTKKTQASNTYQAYKYRGKQIKNPFLKLSTFMDWCSVFPLYLLPHFPPSLCAVLVLFLRCFILPFMHWHIVMPLTPPV